MDISLIKMTTPINITDYTQKFNQFHSDLVEFATTNNIKLPAITSLKGQALALLTQPENRGTKYVSRNEATIFFKALGMDTDDSIQPFNKGFGLKETKCKGKTCIVYPYECDKTDIDKRVNATITGDRDEKINRVKDFWRKILVDVPNKDWQVGHLDPTIPDASETNLAFQPPIQGKYRNRFKWDELFMKMWPTTTELLPNMNKYYTENEQRAIYEQLKKKFDK